MTSTSTDKIAQSTAKILIESGCVLFRPKQPFKYVSGILSPVYVDNRYLISFPVQRKKIAKYYVEKIREIGLPEIIAGTATAGIPHAAWIAEALNLPMVYVRSAPKDHGRGNQVEGLLKRGQKVLVIEDMVSNASSSSNAIGALRKLGAKVTDEIAIYTHMLKGADENFKRLKVKFHSLTNLEEVVSVASKTGFLKPDQIKAVMAWSSDPQNWGKKMGFEK